MLGVYQYGGIPSISLVIFTGCIPSVSGLTVWGLDNISVYFQGFTL